MLLSMMGMIDCREILTYSPGATTSGLVLPSSAGPLDENPETYL